MAVPVRLVEDPNPNLRPLQRLELLCDHGSLHVIRSSIVSDRMGDKAHAGDGVVGAAGRVEGRPIFCFAQDARFAGGSLGAAHADTIVRVQRLASRANAPVVGFVESGGARLQEGLAALDGYARVFAGNVALTGKVPQISVITGTSAGGGCYSPALTDFTVMTDAAAMFLTGPAIVRAVTSEETTIRGLGGPEVHARNGVAQFVVRTDADSVLLVRSLLSYLPQNAWSHPPKAASAEPAGGDPGAVVPIRFRSSYDCRDLIRSIVDDSSELEVSPEWAPNVVTTFARLGGHAIGIVANQPRHLGGVLDAEAAQKGARFVRTCDQFGIPLIVLVDTPGFLPGSEQEAAGVIRLGAQLLRAFAEATVLRCTVVVRKAYGGAYITMNSKDLGADLSLAWTRAELGIMGAHEAVGIVHRRDLEATPEAERGQRRERLADDYAARHLNARIAGQGGHVDEVIRPNDTRRRLLLALDTAAGHRRTRGLRS